MKKDSAAVALALVLDAMFTKINSFKTKEERRAYLKKYMEMSKEERKEMIYRDFKRAVEEVQVMLKKTC